MSESRAAEPQAPAAAPEAAAPRTAAAPGAAAAREPLIAEPLTATAFRPFGAVIKRPAPPGDATGAGWSWWAQAAAIPADDRPLAIGYLALQPAARRFDWAERHARAAEVIVPLDGECVVYVALPAPRPDGFRAFRIRAGAGVVLDPGVWHGAPLALDHPLAAMILLPQGTGEQDTVVARFEDNPIAIEV
jgi:ureidoglycolate lyase